LMQAIYSRQNGCFPSSFLFDFTETALVLNFLEAYCNETYYQRRL
jgi:hypothetical protein